MKLSFFHRVRPKFRLVKQAIEKCGFLRFGESRFLIFCGIAQKIAKFDTYPVAGLVCGCKEATRPISKKQAKIEL